LEDAFAQELGQGRGDGTIIADEPPVVPNEAKEGVHHPDRGRHRPLQDNLDLLFIHGDAVNEDDVVEVCDRSSTEKAFGFLQKKFVLL
jgi:hypothetical protein